MTVTTNLFSGKMIEPGLAVASQGELFSIPDVHLKEYKVDDQIFAMRLEKFQLEYHKIHLSASWETAKVELDSLLASVKSITETKNLFAPAFF